MTKDVNSGTNSRVRVSASFTASHPNARAVITSSMPTNGTAGDAARVPGAPPSSTPTPRSCSCSKSGSSLGKHSRTVTMRHATHPMSTSISAAKGENRVAFQNIQFGCVFGAIMPSMNPQLPVSYEYASFINKETRKSTPIATRKPRARHFAMAGNEKGNATVANVSADKNQVGAFQSSACAGNQACVRVNVISAWPAVATGPLYKLSAYANTHPKIHCARKYSG
mmetsp:Transcript_13345/g.49934  ORF Transcript_13345/g.49934 Transcript_13345/m.49934 type:complete len:225 (+) Transcript_13345:393-1067(+)